MTDEPENELVNKYYNLIEEYLAGKMTPSEFSERYLTEFKNEDQPMGDETFQILQNLFSEADAYCEPEIRDEVSDAIDESELMEAAREALRKLEQQ